MKNIDTKFCRKMANTIRALSIDAVESAGSGHPGMPLGMADIAYVLWHKYLQHSPQHPEWINRDRFILSNGHGSILLYTLLHLTGYKVTLKDLKNFRQLDSITPGHPEYNLNIGVETTTGPLAQGLANAVGMAKASKLLAKQFNKPSFNIIDHKVYCFVGDGCLMEGLSHEVSSLAGTWGLNNLIVIWDDNNISLDGKVDKWFNEQVDKRYEAYGWEVIKNIDGHDYKQIDRALLKAQSSSKPVLICCQTSIGYGSLKNQNSHLAHGKPLGADEALNTKKNLECRLENFHTDEDIKVKWSAIDKGRKIKFAWDMMYENYTNKYPTLALELERRLSRKMSDAYKSFDLYTIKEQGHHIFDMRKVNRKILSKLSNLLPEFIGGSADVSSSTFTNVTPEYIHYGAREFAMFAITNGISLYKAFIPYISTFLVFSDYAKNAIRIAALTNIPWLAILTHDSIAVGQDGPTHQPVEHLAGLRAINNLMLWRPGTSNELISAYKICMKNVKGPSSIILSRQKVVEHQFSSDANMCAAEKGAYILKDSVDFQAIIIATGSEVSIALAAADRLKNFAIRIVSMPCSSVFDSQSEEYKQHVLPNGVKKRIAIEAASLDYWYKYVGLYGLILGVDGYGKSGNSLDVLEDFELTPDKISEKIALYIKGE